MPRGSYPGVGGAISSSTVVYNATSVLAGTDDGGSDANINFRQSIPSSALSPASGSKCQLKILFGSASATEGTTIDALWFGQAGGTLPNFTGDQVQVKFSGSGSVGAGPGKSVTSDVFTLAQAWDHTKGYVFAVHWASTAAGSFSVSAVGGGISGDTTYLDAGGASTAANTIPGNGMAVHDSNTSFLVEEIIISP